VFFTPSAISPESWSPSAQSGFKVKRGATFVLSIAQGGASSLTGADAAVAVLTATASNNLLKAAYTVGFTGHRRGLPVVGTLVPALRRSGVDRIRVNPALTDDLGSVQAG
jgi:hypothetical protein